MYILYKQCLYSVVVVGLIDTLFADSGDGSH